MLASRNPPYPRALSKEKDVLDQRFRDRMGPKRARFRRYRPIGARKDRTLPKGKGKRENTMNNKTKIMLGLSVLTAGTLAAGATGTFAWFTTNKTATATYNNIIAVGTQGNLQASILGLTTSTVKGEQGTNTTATGSKSFISDVSSNDGVAFVQPDWAGESGNTKAINSLETVTGKAGYYTQYSVTLTNVATADNDDAVGGKIKVDLTSITITCADFTEATNWVRVSIFKTYETSTLGTSDKYISSGTSLGVYTNTVTTGTNDKYVKGTKTESEKTYLDLETSSVKSASDLSTNPVEVSDSLLRNASVTIGVSVWLEGTANGDNSQDSVKGKTVSIALGFTATDANN